MPKPRLRDLKVRDFMSRDVVTGTADEPISEILGKMKSKDVHEVPILEGKKLVGVVSMAAIARHRNLQPATKASALLKAAPEVSPDLDVPAAAERFLQSGLRGLPVAEKGKLVGFLSRADVVRALADSEDVVGLGVGEVMTPQPQCVSAEDTVVQARSVMAGLGERAIPVVDKNRRLVGVIGLKDLANLFAEPKAKMERGTYAGEKERMKVQVRSLMRPPITVAADAKLPEALALMAKHRISTVVVAGEAEPAGIVTAADLMELAARFREREGLFVQISGLEEQPDVYDAMYDLIQKAMKRITNLVTPRMLNVHVVQYKADGDNSKWSVRARFATDRQMYYLKHFDWDLYAALDGLLGQLEAQIKKEKDRKVTDRKRGHS